MVKKKKKSRQFEYIYAQIITYESRFPLNMMAEEMKIQNTNVF